MPNWTDSEMGVILPVDNVEKFLSYFLEYNKEDEAGLHYYRTFYESHEVEDRDKQYCKVRVYFSSAWTVHCMLEHYKEDPTVVTLLDVCKECGVYRMECWSIEPGMGFVEEMVYNYGDDDIEFAAHDFIASPENMYSPDDQEKLAGTKKDFISIKNGTKAVAGVGQITPKHLILMRLL